LDRQCDQHWRKPVPNKIRAHSSVPRIRHSAARPVAGLRSRGVLDHAVPVMGSAHHGCLRDTGPKLRDRAGIGRRAWRMSGAARSRFAASKLSDRYPLSSQPRAGHCRGRRFQIPGKAISAVGIEQSHRDCLSHLGGQARSLPAAPKAKIGRPECHSTFLRELCQRS